MNSYPAFPSLFQYVCRVTVYKRRANLTGFSGVVLRLGRFDSRTRDSVTTANPYVALPVSANSANSVRQQSTNQDSHLSGTAGTYLEEMYEAWARDPSSVHASWDAYFRGAQYQAPPGVGMTKANEGKIFFLLFERYIYRGVNVIRGGKPLK